jgi:hypothetical protein
MIGRDVVAVMGIDAMNKRGGDNVLYYLVMVGDHDLFEGGWGEATIGWRNGKHVLRIFASGGLNDIEIGVKNPY